MKDKQLILITELPKEKDHKRPCSGNTFNEGKIEGFNACLSEIKSKAVRVDVEKIKQFLWSDTNKFYVKKNEEIIGIDVPELAQSIKQAIERGEVDCG